jgi:photosystem II stability/assembly factor-like uncharacterized protein
VAAATDAGDKQIYTSTNSGSTWTKTSAPQGEWTSVASSADGCKLVAASRVFPPAYSSWIYTSTNSGVTWTPSAGPSSAKWNSVASSADGARLVAVNFGGGVYTSTNSGDTWTTSSLPPNSSWYAAASSADGTKLIVVAQKGLIYTSTNSGTSWISNGVPGSSLLQQWQSVASSADGSKLAAGAANTSRGAIWTSQTTPAPGLNITKSNGNLALWWIVPATNFVLQQNSDLRTANWTNVTNTLTLNLTNLQNQISLPLPAGNAFYRLKTP